MPEQDLLGKRILVLGGETPLGRALAVGLAERGADVAIASLTSATEADFAINSALNEIWALGRAGLALTIDASDAAQLRDAVARAERDLGRLDAAATVDPSRTDLGTLRAALPARAVIEIRPSASVDEALKVVARQVMSS